MLQNLEGSKSENTVTKIDAENFKRLPYDVVIHEILEFIVLIFNEERYHDVCVTYKFYNLFGYFKNDRSRGNFLVFNQIVFSESVFYALRMENFFPSGVKYIKVSFKMSYVMPYVRSFPFMPKLQIFHIKIKEEPIVINVEKFFDVRTKIPKVSKLIIENKTRIFGKPEEKYCRANPGEMFFTIHRVRMIFPRIEHVKIIGSIFEEHGGSSVEKLVLVNTKTNFGISKNLRELTLYRSSPNTTWSANSLLKEIPNVEVLSLIESSFHARRFDLSRMLKLNNMSILNDRCFVGTILPPNLETLRVEYCEKFNLDYRLFGDHKKLINLAVKKCRDFGCGDNTSLPVSLEVLMVNECPKFHPDENHLNVELVPKLKYLCVINCKNFDIMCKDFIAGGINCSITECHKYDVKVFETIKTGERAIFKTKFEIFEHIMSFMLFRFDYWIMASSNIVIKNMYGRMPSGGICLLTKNIVPMIKSESEIIKTMKPFGVKDNEFSLRVEHFAFFRIPKGVKHLTFTSKIDMKIIPIGIPFDKINSVENIRMKDLVVKIPHTLLGDLFDNVRILELDNTEIETDFTLNHLILLFRRLKDLEVISCEYFLRCYFRSSDRATRKFGVFHSRLLH